jgi:diguanylate cyclase (GGDEF)-like protein
MAAEQLRESASGALSLLAGSPGVWSIDAPAEGLSDAPGTWSIHLADGAVGAVLRAPDGTEVDEALVKPVIELLGALLDAEHRAATATLDAEEALAAAMSDQMTGLANVRAWRQALRREERRCARSGLGAVIAIVDLDDLKVVNDAHGHLAGDLLLRMSADALADTVRSCDLVARLGGDEFGVLAVDYDDSIPSTLVERLTERLAQDEIQASIGAHIHRSDMDIMRSAHLADVAMYEAKRIRKATSPPRDVLR